MAGYWMITDRAIVNGVPTGDQGPLQYFVSDQGPLDNLGNWRLVSADHFKTLLAGAADRFPALDHGANEQQSHVTFFIHGYNNGWDDAARRYQKLCDSLYTGPNSLGICISFDWPSLGSVLGYLPDRDHARHCASDLVVVLSELYDWLLDKQQAAFEDAANACKAKISVIAHSMGNYLVQKAMGTVWTRKNQPLLVSLINQLVMVAADVDNDLFDPGSSDGSDGNALANLTYRISALYSGRDAVLGASAGLKHFGSRRLGRSGLPFRPPTGKDNVWDVDCSSFFPDSVGGMDIHSAYFDNAGVIKLMGDILHGLDRSVLQSLGETQGDAWPTPASK
jgi:esterase/lipase superfamily enzyme